MPPEDPGPGTTAAQTMARMTVAFGRVPREIADSPHISAIAKAAFLLLDSAQNKKTGACDPPIRWLAAKIDRRPRTAERALVELEKAGFIKRVLTPGKRSNYLLYGTTLPALTPVMGDGGQAERPPSPMTGVVPLTPVTHDGGQADLVNMSVKEEEREEGKPPPPPSKRIPKARPVLFKEHLRAKYVEAIGYHLTERPELASLQAWFPDLAFEFIWRHPVWDYEGIDRKGRDIFEVNVRAVVNWAAEKLPPDVRPEEVKATIDRTLGNPPRQANGDDAFSRPDYFKFMTKFLLDQRRRQAPAAAPANQPAEPTASELAGELAEAVRAWQEASEADREPIKRRVSRTIRAEGPFFEATCAKEFLRSREQQTTGERM